MTRIVLIALTLLLAGPVAAKPLTSEQKLAVDAAVSRILKASEVPSASIAIVSDAQLDYAQAYGDQRLDGSAATTTARYPVASISKQFTAASILLLAEDGKLSLDDKVAKYLPALTGAKTITIRQLLSHTAGIRDFWPQFYTFEAMTKPTTPLAILKQWAMAPLDFSPGSKWQYSNTGYTVAGLIVEQVAKEPLHHFQQRRLFRPLGMTVVLGATELSPTDARGSTRDALGPVRAAPGAQPGWMFATADLAMTPAELAKWNIARLTRAVLKPESWAVQETNAAPPAAGLAYGLGVEMDAAGAHRRIKHNGGLSAYRASNRVYPDDRAAISVFVNAGFTEARNEIADAIEAILFDTQSDTEAARLMFEALRSGQIDRARFTANGNFYFTPAVLADYQSSLAPLGPIKRIVRDGPTQLRGGLTRERYILSFADRKLRCVVHAEPDSRRIEEFSISAITE
ncbi:MAG: serine hydrolase domain-containing protein [Pseudomonadota bacterium]